MYLSQLVITRFIFISLIYVILLKAKLFLFYIHLHVFFNPYTNKSVSHLKQSSVCLFLQNVFDQQTKARVLKTSFIECQKKWRQVKTVLFPNIHSSLLQQGSHRWHKRAKNHIVSHQKQNHSKATELTAVHR